MTYKKCVYMIYKKCVKYIYSRLQKLKNALDDARQQLWSGVDVQGLNPRECGSDIDFRIKL